MSLRKGIGGGLTVFNDNLIGKHIKGIYGMSIDVNSLYPSVMLNEKMPIGKPWDFKLYDDMLEYHKIMIIKAKKKWDNLPSYIPSNYDMSKYEVNYLSEVENEYYNLWSWELEKWKEGYDIEYRIVKTWYFEWEYVFKTWVQGKEHLKRNAKHDVDRQYHKTVLNSLYGKFGQNRIRKHKEIHYDPDKTLQGIRYGPNKEWVEQTITENYENLSYIPIASAITAYARCVLIDAFIKNRDIVIYCDTDSMYCMKEPTGVKIHDSEFGAWKPEKKFSEFKFIKPKAYIAQVTHKYKDNQWQEVNELSIALAGLSKENHKQITWENFNKGTVLAEGKRQAKKVSGGMILVDIKYTL